MSCEWAFIESEVVLLSAEEGGRSAPVLPFAYRGGLRPHIVLQDRAVRKPKISTQAGHPNIILDDYLGVEFWTVPDPVPVSSAFSLTMRLAYYPAPMYNGCVPGATFTIREGGRITGHGEIKRRWTEEAPNHPAEPASPRKAGSS